MQAVELDGVAKLGRPHCSDIAAVCATKLWVQPARATAHELASKSKLAQHADAVGLWRHAGADRGQSWRLLVDVNGNAPLQQGMGGRGAADTAADDGHP